MDCSDEHPKDETAGVKTKGARDGPQEPPSAGHETLRKIRDHLHNDAKEIGDLMVSILWSDGYG